MAFLQRLRGLVDPQLTEAMEAHDLQRPRTAIWMDEAALGIGRQCVRWSELARVVAFKPDLPTIDLPCLYLECADGTSLELHETAGGWQALLDALPERVPGCSAVRAVLDALAPGGEAVVVDGPWRAPPRRSIDTVGSRAYDRMQGSPPSGRNSMDSINARQPEDSTQHLQAQAAVAKIKEIVKKAQSCFFCTAAATGTSTGARPMNVRQVDDEGNLWFLSAIDSHKNQELELDPTVTLYFQGSPHSDFLQLTGEATVSRDRAKIEDLWEPVIQTWFTEGKTDPRITVIKVAPYEGYYWDTRHGAAVAGMKMMIGAVLRKTMDDSVEGTVTV